MNVGRTRGSSFVDIQITDRQNVDIKIVVKDVDYLFTYPKPT
jgi:hypothetical protein